MILQMNAEHPQPRRVDQVIEVLSAGGLIAYPTDSVYGIGCDVMNAQAVSKLHALVAEIKGAPDHAPLAFICHSLSNIAEYAVVGDHAYRTLTRMLPGPYTFVLQSTKLVPRVMRTKHKTVGIRIPNAPLPLAIVERLGNPIATTSASYPGPEGELIADPWTLQDMFGHQIDLVIDGGFLFPEPTTVIDFTQDVPHLIRSGKGSVAELDLVLDEL